MHLGVERSKTGRPDVKKKVQLGRRTMYSLMGAGVYGGSGLSPMVSTHLWKIYALSRVLYGLEVQTCLQSDIQTMEQLQRSMLRRIQSFPNSTAIPVISDRLTLADPDCCEIETVSRKLCFVLHLKRCSLMKQLC